MRQTSGATQSPSCKPSQSARVPTRWRRIPTPCKVNRGLPISIARRRNGDHGGRTTLLCRALTGISTLAGLAAILAACATTPPLPPRTVLDSRNHLLASSNFQSEEVKRTRVIVTGMPEGPNKVSDSTNSYLDDFFAEQNQETACGQIYAPNLLGNWARYRDYLEHTLGHARGPVDLLVYSAGAISLMGLSKEFWGDIRSLTFVSPLVGREAFSPGSDPVKKMMAVLLGSRLPPADKYMSSIDELLEHLMAAGVTVRVNLGSGDTLLDNTVIADRFSRYNAARTRIPIEIADRPHGMTASQVNRLCEQVSAGQSQPKKDPETQAGP
jgi:hypothetical protein